MLKVVTSFTREFIPHANVPKLASSVLSVVINNAREPQDMKLVPYDDILSFNKLHNLRIKKVRGRFKAIDNLGFSDKIHHATEAAARIAYWQYKTKGKSANNGQSKRGTRNVTPNKTVH